MSNTHGGRREGAGRKPKNRTAVHFMLDNSLLTWWRVLPSKSDIMNSLIRRIYEDRETPLR